SLLLFSLLFRRPPSATLFPYTTLFRSACVCCRRHCRGCDVGGVGTPERRHAGVAFRRWVHAVRAVSLRDSVSDTRSDGVVEHAQDRKSTRLNSSHVKISYAVFCLKKKK